MTEKTTGPIVFPPALDAHVPIKAWIRDVPVENEAIRQLANVAQLPFVHKHVAVMPDVHVGIGATVGSVIPTKGAIVPAAVGVDIGCGMLAVPLGMHAGQLPDNLAPLRDAIEVAVPHGRTDNGGANDRGAWGSRPRPARIDEWWTNLATGFRRIIDETPKLEHPGVCSQLGTLGTGNHFVEVCIDESDGVWIMLHSGSRGVGNRIGSHYIALARREMERWFIQLPHADLAYLPEGSVHFSGYVRAVGWAQTYAAANRVLMMENVLDAIAPLLPSAAVNGIGDGAVNCHHNYIGRERHFGENVFVTRKGAIRARLGELGIIPGSMGARSFIVRGKGNPESFHSCSHGAGRRMSRTEAKRRFTLEDHAAATAGVECRKDAGVIDETPGAYKDIAAVMAAQTDLVEVVHTLRQVVCVKG